MILLLPEACVDQAIRPHPRAVRSRTASASAIACRTPGWMRVRLDAALC